MAEQVTIELVRHSVAEEAEHARHEHAEAEETLHRLEKLDADDPAFDDELATLMAGRSTRLAEGRRAPGDHRAGAARTRGRATCSRP